MLSSIADCAEWLQVVCSHLGVRRQWPQMSVCLPDMTLSRLSPHSARHLSTTASSTLHLFDG